MNIDIEFGGLMGILILSAALVLSITIGGGYWYNNHVNKLIIQADTCEKAALVSGVYAERIIATCKLENKTH